MPADFQKAIDCTLASLENTFCFLDHILIVSRGGIEKHLHLVRKCLIKLDQENLRINLAKCHFAKETIEWLGHNITQSDVTPLSSKTDAIGKLSAPTNLKKLRSFMGSVHHLRKFIPNLSQLCYPLRPLLKKNSKFLWTEEHDKQFSLIKEQITETTENKRFNPELETRIKCDASRKGLGCALEQRTTNGWHTVAFASRFLNSVEDRYSINELELLDVVWSVEHFKYYLYGKPFTVITDHRALLSIMRENRSNKSYNSRLTRWVDRLLPFDFSIDHLPGTKMGLVDYISRDPHQQAANISTYDEQFIVAKLDVIKRSAKRFLLNAENYVDFAARNQSTNCVVNNPNSTNNLCSDFAPRNPEHSTSTQIDGSISELMINSLNSIPKIETTNIPHSLFALNRPTKQSLSNLNHFQRIATKFKNVYMMSQSSSDDETLMTVKQSTPSRVRFAEAGPSTVQAAPVTPITPTTDTTAPSPSVDDLYLDSFNFALSKIFSSSPMASLITKDAILKEIRDCILTDNEDRCRQISPYIHSFRKDLHVKNGCVCIDDRIALPHAIKDAYVDAIHATHPGTWGMTGMATHAWWPYMHRDIATKTAKCNPCVKIDLETVRWDQLITDENWNNDKRSDIEMEINKDKLGKEAMKRHKDDPNKESRLISHPDVGQPIPRTESSLEVKLAKKRPRIKRSKKSLDGLYDVLAPGSSVIKTNENTSVIKEPGKREVTIRNSDLAKFGTKAERNTDLQIYANRRPKLPTGKTTEELIHHHAKESRKKLEGGKKMKHRKVADDVSTVSFIHSNVTRALRVRMPTKPKKQQTTAPPNQTTASNNDLAVPKELPTSSIVIAEPPSRPKRKAASKASAALLPSKRKRSAISTTESDEYVTPIQSCPPPTPSTAAIGKQKRRQNLKKQQIENKSIISAIQTAAAQSNQEESNFTVGPCSPTTSYPTQFYVSPNYEEPELSMTVGEAERYYESESD